MRNWKRIAVSKVFAARKTNVITARARKIKRSAHKDRSIPLKLNELLPVLTLLNLPRNKFQCCKLQQYASQSRPEFYFLQQISSTCNTEICRVASWARGGNTSNNSFNLQCNNVARQVERKCCPYYLAFTLTVPLSTQEYKCRGIPANLSGNVFPRLAKVTYICFDFSLAHFVINDCFDWSL